MKFCNDTGDWDLDSTCAVVGMHEEEYYNRHNKTPCINVSETSCVVEPWWKRGTNYGQPEPPLDDGDNDDDQKKEDVVMDKKGMMTKKPSEVIDCDVILCGGMDCWNLCWNVNDSSAITASRIDTATSSPPETDSSEEIRDPVDKNDEDEEEVDSSSSGRGTWTDPMIKSNDDQVDLPNETPTLVSPTILPDDVRHHDHGTQELDRTSSCFMGDSRGTSGTLGLCASNVAVDSHPLTQRVHHEAEEERPVELLEEPVCSYEEQHADSFTTSSRSNDHILVASKTGSSSSNVMVNPYDDDNQAELGKGETCRCHAPACKVM